MYLRGRWARKAHMWNTPRRHFACSRAQADHAALRALGLLNSLASPRADERGAVSRLTRELGLLRWQLRGEGIGALGGSDIYARTLTRLRDQLLAQRIVSPQIA